MLSLVLFHLKTPEFSLFHTTCFHISFSLWHAKLFSSIKVETHSIYLLQSSLSLLPVDLIEHSWWFLLCHFTFYYFYLWKTFLFLVEIIFLYSGVHSRTIIKFMSSFPQLSKKSRSAPFSFILLWPLWLSIVACADLPRPLLKYLKASAKFEKLLKSSCSK